MSIRKVTPLTEEEFEAYAQLYICAGRKTPWRNIIGECHIDQQSQLFALTAKLLASRETKRGKSPGSRRARVLDGSAAGGALVCRISKEMHVRFAESCREVDVSMNEVLSGLIEEYLE